MELDLLIRKIKKPVSMERIIEKAKIIGEYTDEEVIDYVNKKVNNYEIIKTKNNNYIPIYKTSFRVGTYKRYKNGSGEVKSGENKYFISENNNQSVITGDLVLIDTYIPKGSKEKSCRIEKVLERDLTTLVGEIVKLGDNYYIEAEEKDKKNLTIALEGNNYIEGEKVIVDCSDQRSDNFYVGKIIKSIGHKNEPGMDIIMEAYKHGIDPFFSNEVLEETEQIKDYVEEKDYENRIDLRDKEIFTIDGDDTKDIDDAISLEKLDNGNYLLGVHIADVTHYVHKNSAIYNSAKDRATSSYLANKVIPMLPRKLSNGICSLNPGVDRLAMSCIMEFDNKGNLVDHKLFESVIRSNIQMTYNKVNDILEKNIIDDKYKIHTETLFNMLELSNILHNKRIKNGAVEINNSELKLIIDENDEVIDFSRHISKTGENLIEEFMLAANECVAKHMSKYPFIYRVHESFNEDKMQSYITMLDSLGFKCDFDAGTLNVSQKILEILNDNNTFSEMLRVQLLRTFKKAFYSDENIGHYGLASENYCHFTSPIRRFPDTTVHQLIKDFEFSNKDKEQLRKEWEESLSEIAKHSSNKERASDDCERMVLLMKCAEYMEKHIGDEFIGTVISIDSDGLYIELDNMVEGKVRLKDLKGNYFYNESNYSFISLDGEEDYYLGDVLNLYVSHASKERKEINFKIKSKLVENTHINKKENNKVKVYKREAKRNNMYYNVNKGRKK